MAGRELGTYLVLFTRLLGLGVVCSQTSLTATQESL